MADSKCPVCGNMSEIKKEKIVDWIKQWDESQWSSKQLELLQKTLDVVEKLTPRPIILSERSEVIK